MKIKAKYLKVLEGYLLWCGDGLFLRPRLVLQDHNAPSAAAAMKLWESEGVMPSSSSEPELLQRYMQGKKSRDWHITEWKEGVRMGLFVAEEFIGTLGCTSENFSSIFGRTINASLVPSGIPAC